MNLNINKEETLSEVRSERKQMIVWLVALLGGIVLGLQGWGTLDHVMTFIATIYTRLFQFVAVPTIVLAVIVTLATFGRRKDTGRIFSHAVSYTMLTTIAATALGMVLYLIIAPGNLPESLVSSHQADAVASVGGGSYTDYLLNIVPDNVVKPFLEGNVLSLLLISFAVGFALAVMPETEQKNTVMNFLKGLQDLLAMLIRGLIWSLPLGIVAFAAQLSAEVSAGVAAESLGKYVAVILSGNIIQMLVVLPLFLLARGINPVRALGRMMPAVLMALFTKSSAATLPVTISSAENRMKISPRVARFVLPLCTTINMNGCAAFIFVTSLFVMQNGGVELSIPTMILWLFISVIAAVGNAGVPMGCFFLTMSLMTGAGMPVGIMGIILPIYTILDMVETAENVWSDSCVAIMTDKDLK